MRVLRRLSITTRIAVGSLVVAIVFVAAGAFVVRLSVESIVHSATVTLLKHDAADYLPAPGQAPSESDGQDSHDRSYLKLIAIVNPQNVATYSALPKSLNARLSSLAQQGDDPRTIKTATDAYLVYTLEVETPAGHWHIVAARDLDASDLVLRGVDKALVIGAIVLVLGFGGASWLLAMLALRPVSKMRREAQTIADERSTGLLPIGRADDELAALAKTLNNLISQLRASAERERQMVSDASHELRTPIAVLQNQLELAHLSAGDVDALLADLEASEVTARRLAQMATNLLELSRLEASPARGAATWAELVDELASAIDRVRLLTAGSNITVDFESVPAADGAGQTQDDGGAVALSAYSFGRILDNLLRNAAAAVGSDGWVSARLERIPERVVLLITDSGSGMPDEFIPIALDRFTRSEESRSSRSGSGLGLAIVDALVFHAGGDIHLENTEHAGLRVRIGLPTTR